MADLWFVIRMIVVTLVLVVLMQIKIGSFTIEQHGHQWVQSSTMVTSLQNVAHGAVKALTQGYRAVTGVIDTNVSKVVGDSPGDRLSAFAFGRSEGYRREQEAKRAKQEKARAGAPSSDDRDASGMEPASEEAPN